jgi:hypothetical protein
MEEGVKEHPQIFTVTGSVRYMRIRGKGNEGREGGEKRKEWGGRVAKLLII